MSETPPNTAPRRPFDTPYRAVRAGLGYAPHTRQRAVRLFGVTTLVIGGLLWTIRADGHAKN